MYIENKKFYICFILIFLVLFGCSKSTNQNKYVLNVQKSTVKPISLFKKWRCITLETSDNILISKIDKIVFYDNKIIVLDKKANSLFIFDEKGRFLNLIHKQGQGRGEYIYISDVNVCKSIIYVLDPSTQKILGYTFKGRFVNEYPVSDLFFKFSLINDHMMYLYSDFSNRRLYNFILFDYKKNKIIDKFYPFKKNQSTLLSHAVFNQSKEKDLLVNVPFDLTIYKLTPSGLLPYASIDFGSHNKIPINFQEIDFLELSDYCSENFITSDFSCIYKIQNKLYLCYLSGFYYYLSEIDMKSHKVKTVWLNSLVDDTDDKMPYIYARPLCFYNGQFISYLMPETILGNTDKFKSDKNLDGLLHEDDNPVLFFHQLR